VAGGLGLEPRLHGTKGRRAADYPIPHLWRSQPTDGNLVGITVSAGGVGALSYGIVSYGSVTTPEPTPAAFPAQEDDCA
jgi:hypothetical protein